MKFRCLSISGKILGTEWSCGEIPRQEMSSQSMQRWRDSAKFLSGKENLQIIHRCMFALQPMITQLAYIPSLLSALVGTIGMHPCLACHFNVCPSQISLPRCCRCHGLYTRHSRNQAALGPPQLHLSLRVYTGQAILQGTQPLSNWGQLSWQRWSSFSNLQNSSLWACPIEIAMCLSTLLPRHATPRTAYCSNSTSYFKK